MKKAGNISNRAMGNKRNLLILLLCLLLCIAACAHGPAAQPETSAGETKAAGADGQTKLIRVRISNNNSAVKYHYTITLKGTDALTVRSSTKTETVPAGREFSVRAGDARLTNHQRLYVTAADPAHEIAVTSITREQGIPGYQGTLEIVEDNDVLYLVNELPVEQYLRKVVPSEMPATFAEEAFKAQAVCARTYAYNRIAEKASLGISQAQVEDDTNDQVYNNLGPLDVSDRAISETQGQALLYKGDYASAFFYSTSCGVSTNTVIWDSTEKEYPYLTSHALTPGRELLNLTTNKAFAQFLKKPNRKAYDSGYPYFRWTAETTNLLMNEKLTRFGNILSVEITGRGEGGVARKMRIEGSERTEEIVGSDQIRIALGHSGLKITTQDGKSRDGWTSLPSAFISVSADPPDENNVIHFHIAGGGIGHGVGMSQSAADQMSRKGMDYRKILTYFFAGCTVG